MINNPLNCWKILKLHIPQRRDETCSSVMVTKVERKYVDSAWLNPKRFLMDNQQPSSEQEKVQRLSASKQRTVVGILKDEDIVCTLWKHRDALCALIESSDLGGTYG